jgi:hypothetical protein
VPSYEVKISESCFVWTHITAACARPYFKIEEQAFSTLTRGAESNPARVSSRRSVARLEENNFQIFSLNGFSLSIETDVIPVQINIALNREGGKLTFNQSYQFEVTTVPLGLHYITS